MSPSEDVLNDRAARHLFFVDVPRARRALLVLLLLAPAATARAQGVTAAPDSAAPDAAGVGAAYQLAWGDISESGARVGVAYDHALAPDRTLTLGGRAGAYVAPHLALPFVGARLLLWTAVAGAPGLRVWGGLGVDLWFGTTASVTDPVLLYTGLDLGVRLPIGGAFFVEVPLQFGVLPLASPLTDTFSAGVRVGRTF